MQSSAAKMQRPRAPGMGALTYPHRGSAEGQKFIWLPINNLNPVPATGPPSGSLLERSVHIPAESGAKAWLITHCNESTAVPDAAPDATPENGLAS